MNAICCAGEFTLLERSTQLKSKVEAKERSGCVVEAWLLLKGAGVSNCSQQSGRW